MKPFWDFDFYHDICVGTSSYFKVGLSVFHVILKPFFHQRLFIVSVCIDESGVDMTASVLHSSQFYITLNLIKVAGVMAVSASQPYYRIRCMCGIQCGS
jgi:hypothetical protein